MKSAYDHFNNEDADIQKPDRDLGEAGPSLSETGECTTAENNDTLSYFNFLTGSSAPLEIFIDADIAFGVEKVLAEGLTKDNLNTLQDKYNPPTNCSRISVLQCNPEIFKNTSQAPKTRDSALQTIQKSVTKGLTAVLLAFGGLSAIISPETSKPIKQLADGIALLAYGSHALDLHLRHAFRGELKEEYSSLCSEAHPIVCSLFGPNVQNCIKLAGSNHTIQKPVASLF
ncbi:hypothetical protein EGW08_019371 [Elysia chlorotica]|uniref:Uncharacterized protein n=1 Tax=Elysia chlorotica TaxID=188477 RepID=A0A433SUA0_ELYCH|nr:hypothetical protein EGW08_019371 [Elysia chlorotica]